MCMYSSSAVVGENCEICSGVFVDHGVRIGDRVIVESGARLYGPLILENDVTVGPNAAFWKAPSASAIMTGEQTSETVVHERAIIGANATVLSGLAIGVGAVVGSGAVITRPLPANTIAEGNPARIVGYVGAREVTQGRVLPGRFLEGAVRGVVATDVAGVTLHELPLVKDMRGNLSVGEFERSVPFSPQRYFVVFDVPSKEIRGEHAHRRCHQFLICLKGSCAVVTDDGSVRQEFFLDRPNLGLYLPPMVWGVQYKHTPDAVLLIFASDYYDPNDYIRSYEEFMETVVPKRRQ